MGVTLEQIKGKIVGETYIVMPDGRTTLCQLTLENGYSINGMSACVDAKDFDRDTGRRYAYEDAVRQIWPLEGYLLAEKMYWENAKPLASNPPKRITMNPQQVEAMKAAGVWNDKQKRNDAIEGYAKLDKKPHWTQTAKGKKIMAQRRTRGKKLGG
jgi:hypothetical protein